MLNYYDQTARNYNELHGQEQRNKIRVINQYVEIPDDYFTLDVGCGSGISSEIAKKVVGIDPSIELLKQSPYPVACAGAENLPFGDNVFDCVVSLTAIQNFTDLRKGLEEIRRVGSKLFILTLLKRSSKLEDTRKILNEIFSDKEITEVEEFLDIIFIIK